MVIHLVAYSPPFNDIDLSAFKAINKCFKQKNLHNIEFALQAARDLISKMKLSQNVQHYPSKNPQLSDFIFEGAGFHDPGDIVE
jgi:hypothetical protein